MSTHLPGFQSFFKFLHHFVLAKLATGSIRVEGLDTVKVSWLIARPCLSQQALWGGY